MRRAPAHPSQPTRVRKKRQKSSELQSTSPLTFGVELEGIFVWHSNLLPLEIEPFHVVCDLLEESRVVNLELDTDFSRDPEDEQKQIFRVVPDNSVHPFSAANRFCFLQAKVAREIKNKDWASHGLEFVSAPYRLRQLGHVERSVHHLAFYLNTRLSWITTNETCGFHVHIGRIDDKPHPAPVLKVLMFMTLVYECEISKLHASHRAWGKNCNLTRSNLFALIPPSTHLKRDKWRDPATHKQYHTLVMSIAEIRRMLFSGPSHSYSNIEAMSKMMGHDKYHIINWTHSTARHNGRAATVEFRQHAGTFDPITVRHWVCFCAALVQTAYDVAEQGRKCFPDLRTWADRICLEDLLNVMELPTATKSRYLKTLREAEDDGEWMEPDFWEEA